MTFDETIVQNVSEKIWKILYSGQNFLTFFFHILGNGTTSYFHSEINRPLVLTTHSAREQLAAISRNLDYVQLF
jgi:hypothetical protein